MILKQGSQGEDVKKLQNALIEKGYDVGTSGADGIYGTRTASAVTAYQKANGLSVDGEAGEQTMGSLYGTATQSTAEQTENVGELSGVSKEVTDAMKTPFELSDSQKETQSKADNYRDAWTARANKPNIVDQSDWFTLKEGFTTPTSVLEADKYLSSQLKKIQRGRTSYSDSVEAMIEKIMNRESFSYDADTDPLFQQALASAMGNGKTAMQDTIGQASALTGGYGSTYATAAGNQAYQSFIEDAYNNLPEYYSMALSAYQNEGQDMYNQLGMLSDADAQEYQRMVNAYDATSQWRNQQYSDAYNLFRDAKTDALNSANLRLNENSQLVDNAYNIYADAQNRADTKYAQEYDNWTTEYNKALQMAQMLNTDWWNKTNMEYQKERDAVADSQWERQFALSQQAAARSGSSGSGSSRSSSGSSSSSSSLKSPTQKQMQDALEAANSGGKSAYNKYMASLPSNVDTDAIADYVWKYEDIRYTKTKDTWNWFGGIDHNDEVTDQYGTTYKIDNLGLSEEEKKALTKLKEGETYNHKR